MARQVFFPAVEIGSPRHDDARNRARFRDRDARSLFRPRIRGIGRDRKRQSGRNGAKSKFPAHGSLTLIPLEPV
jgi:hypothetical protein